MQPYKLSLIATLALVWVVFGISQAESSDKIFNTGQGGFMFVYPGNWTDSTPQGSEVKAAVKATGSEAKTGANCLVVSSQDPAFKGLALPQTKEDLFDVLGSDFCRVMAPNWQNTMMDYEGTTFVDNIPALLCKASGTTKNILGTFRLKTIYVILIKPPSSYSIQCYATESDYDAMESTFINLLASFAFID